VDAPVSVNLQMEHSGDIGEEESENGVVSSTGMVSEKAMMKWFCSRETDHQAVKFFASIRYYNFDKVSFSIPEAKRKRLETSSKISRYVYYYCSLCLFSLTCTATTSSSFLVHPRRASLLMGSWSLMRARNPSGIMPL
jgi:hypothetical protein